ncbi:group II intron reverse transcriptase/maturase [Methylomonas koyamae]|uniref:group II intron reverse transcriptase/maturase n=2 Tax=Methylomonas koyamae TaxID=702114 RepID=UPI000BC351B8|nr:group II intron reverse transcriptase/maturase [Methylomonas koyamae]ATG90988.1 group II intron reverse transcriptase/maturase [Methylomonas koyamae]
MTAPTVSNRTKQGTETAGIPGVEAAIWTDRMVSALVNGVEGHKWYSLMDKVYAPTTLALAWAKVKVNRGAAGVDRQSVEQFEAQADHYLAELSQSLREGTYRPMAVKRVEIPKGDGQRRPLGIPTVKDRIVQAGVKLVIEPIFEVIFLNSSYGFRPGRGCKDALREVDRWLRVGYTYVVDADLKAYFDSIPHGKLMERVEARISDGRVLELIESWLQQDILQGLESWTPTSGSPQGAVISPLLANLYLHPLDERLMAQGYRMVRYADDFVVLCADREEAEAALALIRDWVDVNELSLHPDKTHMGDCRQVGQGFEFLGYRFEAGKRWVRKKSLNRLKDRIREKTRRTRGDSLARIVADLNPMLRGWYAYFKHAQSGTFRNLDGFIRRRLRALLRKQDKRPGFGRCQADHQRWPNAYFAAVGLFALHPAWQAERHPR